MLSLINIMLLRLLPLYKDVNPTEAFGNLEIMRMKISMRLCFLMSQTPGYQVQLYFINPAYNAYIRVLLFSK